MASQHIPDMKIRSFPIVKNYAATEQPPAKAGGLVLWTESPDTGPRPVVSAPCESCPRDSARSDVPDTLWSSLRSSAPPWHQKTRGPSSAVPRSASAATGTPRTACESCVLWSGACSRSGPCEAEQRPGWAPDPSWRPLAALCSRRLRRCAGPVPVHAARRRLSGLCSDTGCPRQSGTRCCQPCDCHSDSPELLHRERMWRAMVRGPELRWWNLPASRRRFEP